MSVSRFRTIRALAALGALAVVGLSGLTRSASAQPGLALGDPNLAIARNSIAPLLWRSGPIVQPVSLVVPWFGSSDELPADAWRTLLVVEADSPAFGPDDPQPGPPLLLLRYNPALSAVEMLTRREPVVGRDPVPGEGGRSVGAIRVKGVPLGEARHHCAVFTFDPDTNALTLHVVSQGSDSVRSAAAPAPGGALPPMAPFARIFFGNPLAGGTSHTGPIFTTVFRRGLIDAATLLDTWQTPGGPRLTDLTGPGSSIDDDAIFLALHAGSRNYTGPADDGRMQAWYSGESPTWLSVAGAKTLTALHNGAPTTDLTSIALTPVFEPGMPWSGWWQPATPIEELRLELTPVAGTLPRLAAVLAGSRVGDTALTAWGLGNSRWANTTLTPTSLTDPTPLSRSHLLGLRAARPARDGGLVLLSFTAVDSIADFAFLEDDSVDVDRTTNWTRFNYGSSFAPTPGTGAPAHIDAGGTLAFVSDLGTALADSTHPTQSIALLLERPRGGRVTIDAYTADADGTARITTNDPAITPLPGTPGEGLTPIDTDTTRVVLPIAAVTASTVTVAGDASAVLPGDVLVGEDDRVVNVVEAVEGQVVTLRFDWVEAPAPGETAAFGPARQRLVGFVNAAPVAEAPRRGLRFAGVDGGRVTVTAAGLRSLDPNRICYVLAGRGGLGQQQQADREAPGTLAAMVDALGVELFFTGLATQSADTVPALEAQLGDRLLTSELIGTADVMNAQSNTTGSQNSLGTHTEIRDGAIAYDSWAYFQIQDDFPAMLDQYMLLWRHDAPHANGRGMLAAGEMWWTRLEAIAGTLLTNNGCLADTNRDGVLSPADFNAFVSAYNTGSAAAEQNGDGVVTPADFNGWVLNFTAGCP